MVVIQDHVIKMVHVIIVKQDFLIKLVQQNVMIIAININVILILVNALVVMQDFMEKNVQNHVDIVLLLFVIK